MRFLALFFVFSSMACFSLAEEPGQYPKKRILIPIAYYTPETSAAGGFLFIQNFNKERQGKTSNIQTIGSLTLLGQSSLSIKPTFYFSGGDFEVAGKFKYSYYPDRFFGRGFVAHDEDGEKFTQETTIASANVAKNLYQDLFLRLEMAYEKYLFLKWDPQTRVAQEISSFGGKYEVPHLGLSFEWDSRDFPQAPKQGAYYKLSARYYDPHNIDHEGGSLEPFQKYEIDLRQYFSLTQEDILAFQALNSEITGTTIPFQYLNSIGGGSRLRGYYEGRYRDQALRVFQAEYRHEFDDHWVGSSFFGIASLGNDESALDSSRSSKYFGSGGVGVNYIIDTENRTKLRADIGVGNGDWGFYFLIGEAY